MTFMLGRNRPEVLPQPHAELSYLLRSASAYKPPHVENWVRHGSAPIYHAMEDIYGNDRYGDCTAAGTAHVLDVLRASVNLAHAWRVPTTADVLAFYSRCTDPPFDPATGANDNGADEVTVLDVWQEEGFFSDGTGKIRAWATVDATKEEEVETAIWLFGHAIYCAEIPDAYTQISGPGFDWTVAGPPVPSNGHMFMAYGYNALGDLVDTWGLTGTLDRAARAYYCTPSSGGGCYVALGDDWISAVTQKSPSGEGVAELDAALTAVFG